jgi:competence ComEA-like helix-hairpin-helix protein
MHTTQPQALATTSTQLALVGNCGYQIQDNRIVINIDEIASRRDLGDLSGTLSIELWALKQPYQGGEFSGTSLAGTQIGEMLGQHYLANCQYDLLLQEPPAGSWYLTLMLREWTDAGFVTRDFVNFALPYEVSGKATVVRSETDNVINVSFAGSEKPAAKIVAEQPQPAEAKPAAPKTEQPKAQAPVAETAATSEQKAKVAAPKAKQSKPQVPAMPAAAAKQVKPSVSGKVALNKASRKEIASIKGISRKLAEDIVSARPFKSLDDLLKVKGMGPKLLHKVRDLIHI